MNECPPTFPIKAHVFGFVEVNIFPLQDFLDAIEPSFSPSASWSFSRWSSSLYNFHLKPPLKGGHTLELKSGRTVIKQAVPYKAELGRGKDLGYVSIGRLTAAVRNSQPVAGHDGGHMSVGSRKQQHHCVITLTTAWIQIWNFFNFSGSSFQGHISRLSSTFIFKGDGTMGMCLCSLFFLGIRIVDHMQARIQGGGGHRGPASPHFFLLVNYMYYLIATPTIHHSINLK